MLNGRCIVVALLPACNHDASDEAVIDCTGDVDMTLAKIAGSSGLAATILDVFQNSLFSSAPQVCTASSNSSVFGSFRDKQLQSYSACAIGQTSRCVA